MTKQQLCKYQVFLHWSEDDQAYIAQVIDLPGCAAHGSTKVEALSNVEDAASLWIQTAAEVGRVLPQAKGKRDTTNGRRRTRER